MNKAVKKLFFNLSGFIFLSFGVAGVFLPLLPATPFLLLAGFFFSKGSPTFHHWLITHKIFGPPIKDWETKGVIRINNKIFATVMLIISAGVIWTSSTIPLFGKVGFSILATGILTFVWTRPST
jgi:uncharacterized membrane protein YbaN (DUF454 family)